MRGSDVEFGLAPSRAIFGDSLDPEHFTDIAVRAEDRGFDAIWAGDHVTFPEEIPNEYPFSPSGDSPFDISMQIYEMFQRLATVCPLTSDIRIGTNVCIVPYRHPVLLSKSALTLAVLSEERFEFGVGTGWMPTEFEVLDVPYEERGSRTDEFLELFERVCDQGEVAFEGPHHSFQKTGFYPIPDEQPPIWVGGNSGAAFRRIAEYGDGWTIIWLHPEEVSEGRQRLMNAWDDFNRAGEPEIALCRPVDVGPTTRDETERLFIGSAESIVEDIEQYVDAGVTRIVFDFYANEKTDHLDQLDRLTDEVLPSFID